MSDDSKVVVKRVALSDALKSNDPDLWVINTSDNKGARKKGEVLLSVKDTLGEGIAIRIYATWLPFNLIDYTTKDIFLGSTSFRDYVRKGLLTVIDGPSAKKLLKLPRTISEIKRLKDMGFDISLNAEGSLDVQLLTDVEQTGSSPTMEKSTGVGTSESEDSTILTWVGRIKSGDFGEFVNSRGVEFASFLAGLPMSSVTNLASKLNLDHPVYGAIDLVIGNLAEGRQTTADEVLKLLNSSDTSGESEITIG